MTRRRLLIPAAVLAAASLALPAAASAHPRRAKPTVTLHFGHAFTVKHATVEVTGRPLHLVGTVTPFVPGQKVTVRAFVGKRRVADKGVHVVKAKGGRTGRFGTVLTAHTPGQLVVSATHRRTRRMLGFTARRGLREVAPDTHDATFTALVQRLLADRHLYLPQSGRWDLQTELAIDAYHRLLHRGTSEDLDGPTLTDLFDGHGSFHIRYPKDGRHAEGDLPDQLLALADGDKVSAIYPISSGKSTTPTILGRYQVYRRTPGYLSDGMYYSDFFIRGYAIHGYEPAPDYPASHGCMRLPISDAISVFDWLTYGDWVDVYQ